MATQDQDTLDTNLVDFQWEAAADPDSGDVVSYRLLYSFGVPFDSATAIVIASLSNTSYSVQLPQDSTISWKVEAYDRFGLATASIQSDWYFTIKPTCTPGLLGDVNGDDFANSTDGLVIISFDAGVPLPPPIIDRINLGFGDVNEDGITNSTDGLITMSYDAGIPVPFPVGNPVCLPDNSRKSQNPVTVTPKEGESVSIFAVPNSNQITKEMTVDIPLIVDMSKTTEKLGSYTAELKWDPQVFEFISFSGGATEGFGNPVVNDTEAEKGKLRFAHAYPYGATGEVIILILLII